jgi:threonine dehydrogenase-like Zn-dependent dehydrogenase
MKGRMKGFGIIEPCVKVGWMEKDIPEIGYLDALLKPVVVAPCTSDTHGSLQCTPECAGPKGRILGHEVVAEIVEVGRGAKDFKPGDIVAIPAATPNYRAIECQDNIAQHAGGMMQGMVLSTGIDGCFAEYFTVPDIDNNAAFIPKGVSIEQAVLTGDMVTTGFHGAELADIKFGDTVVVIGIGPVGLMAVAGSALRGAGTIIGVGHRSLTKTLAREYGASVIVDYKDGDIFKQVMDVTGGRLVDKVIVTGGGQSRIALAMRMLKPNGIVVNLEGMYEELRVPAMDSMMWCAHKTLTGGICPGGRRRMERLFDIIKSGRVDPARMITQTLHGMEGIEEGFNLMMDPKPADVVKPIVYIDD